MLRDSHGRHSASERYPAPIRLHLLPDAPDASGEPRAALLVPPSHTLTRRPALRVFATVAAAIAAKRLLEAGQ
ncbi:hypothetical protein [Roseomonas sp. BN140053]|uniref:hypothetical protein n=1 Tax=Roseomonas sp. BN140053 TaxID=3391898 RepID=UPI0039E7DB82